MEKCKTILLACLIVLMLAAAGIYIGGSQLAAGGAADVRTALPNGAVPVGTDAPAARTLRDAGLLVPEAAVVSYAGSSVGAYAHDIPAALTTLAFPLIHQALESGAVLSAADRAAVTAAAAGDCIYLRLPGALPYQLLYALTGDIDKAAAADFAISADTLLLAFDEDGAGRLYLAGGGVCAVSDKPVAVRAGALAALAASDALTEMRLTENLVPVGEASVTAFALTIEDGGEHPLQSEAGSALLALFGFNPDRHRLSAQTVVEPHGSLSVNRTRALFAASRDGGIPITAFLEDGKDARDIDIYDILTAAAAFAERLRTASPENFGGAATPFLKSFVRDGDGYTVSFGLVFDGIELCGAADGFLTLTASGGMFTSVTARRLCIARAGLALTLFPAGWQYAAAAKHAGEDGIRTLRLLYEAETLPAVCDAAFYCDRLPFDAAPAESAAVSVSLIGRDESEAAQ